LRPYSSWRRKKLSGSSGARFSLRPSGARSSHWYMRQSPSRPRARRVGVEDDAFVEREGAHPGRLLGIGRPVGTGRGGPLDERPLWRSSAPELKSNVRKLYSPAPDCRCSSRRRPGSRSRSRCRTTTPTGRPSPSAACTLPVPHASIGPVFAGIRSGEGWRVPDTCQIKQAARPRAPTQRPGLTGTEVRLCKAHHNHPAPA
jgi:hypothetical protein